jgi:2-keto-4-pentenoate hydratase/2-oxohepta-3-ene-1,7-dioic acid hydratase in catechol pathway
VEEAPIANEELLTTAPVTFFRTADSFVGAGQPLVRPAVAESYDYEGELAVVIGRTAWHVQPEEAYGYIGGYAAANEGCVREWLMHTLQWTPGKNFWHAGAWGPWLVTPDEVGDITTHTITTRVNGEQRQHDSLANMIHDIPACISYITMWTPLHTGDVILMGTPAGVGAANPENLLHANDVVEVELSFVGGQLRNPVVDESPDHSPLASRADAVRQ